MFGILKESYGNFLFLMSAIENWVNLGNCVCIEIDDKIKMVRLMVEQEARCRQFIFVYSLRD